LNRKRKITMKTVFMILMLLSITTKGQDQTIDSKKALSVFNEVKKASKEDGLKLWGQALEGPILFVDPKTRFVIANQMDKENQLTKSEGVFSGKFPVDQNIANTSVKWAGVNWTMVMWPLPENKYARMKLVIHECFHRIQSDMGLSATSPPNAHLDSKDGRIWLRLEFRALTEALINQGAKRKKAIEDALIFRSYRRHIFPKATEQENALELNEGLAEYTGIKLSGWPAHIIADRAAIRLEQNDRSTRFSRSFAYASGPAWSILLDEENVKWRKSLHSESDLSVHLQNVLNLDIPIDLKEEAHLRAREYDGAQVLSEEETRRETQQIAIAKHRKKFIDGQVLIFPFGEKMSYSFNPNNAESLGDLGTVYLTTRMVDVWGILEVSKGALLTREESGKIQSTRVAISDTFSRLDRSGDGWELTLTDGWTIVPSTRKGDFRISRIK